jgi:hypothetical protein
MQERKGAKISKIKKHPLVEETPVIRAWRTNPIVGIPNSCLLA